MLKINKGLLTALAAVALMAAGAAQAGTTVTYTGQGFNYDGTTYNLNDERCGLTGQNDANDGGTGQFATWNDGQPYETGDGYLVWVLTANGATSAKLNLPGGVTVPMFAVGGTFKYASGYYSRDTLVNFPVTAVYEGKAKGNVQLTVSHGCKPYLPQDKGAWCSPGFWRNAADAAWALTGHTNGEFFNATVVPGFYDTASAADPTLNTVLTTPGANTFGAASAPYGLNAFNATGAFLTNSIPGYHFDLALYDLATLPGGDDSLSCPIDNHGNFKE